MSTLTSESLDEENKIEESDKTFVFVIVLAKKKIIFDEILVVEDVQGEILVVEDVLEVVVVDKEVLNSTLFEEKTKQKSKKDNSRVSSI